MATRVSYPPPRDSSGHESSAPSILAIVVTHEGRDWLRESLIALNSQKYPLLDVLVVDDASPSARRQPTLRRVAKRHLKKRRWGYVRTPRPLGFGGAINWALSRVKTDSDLLLFLHDDAVLEKGSLERMVSRLLADDSTAIVGPKVVSWDDASRLEEVGMAIDRLGYPYKGLEEGEIDLGQHDRAVEVFYVTSTCMLVRHDVFRKLKGWDARLRAFSEDLDLCWRARVAGHEVRVEPEAKARHLMGLATGRRRSPFTPARYFIRRNRLRTMAKNVSTPRLLALLPFYILVALLEMIGFAILRQPREVGALVKALGWNLFTFPQTLAERAKVQGTRTVPDRKLRRLTVREGTRVRAYVGQQADRLEEAWGRRAEVLSRRIGQAKIIAARLKGWPVVALILAVVFLILGFRHILFQPPAAVGELLPYPERATGLWRAFLAPWRSVGLGEAGPAPPAFALLGFFPMLTFGAVGMAQKVLIFFLAGVAFAGASVLVSDLVDRPARLASGAAYALGAIGYAGVRHGDLAAMVFAAAAPFAVTSMIRLIGWVRPPNWNRGGAVTRVALCCAVSAAFVPGSLVFYLIVAVLLTSTRTFLEHGSRPFRGLISCLVASIVGFVMLLPWSATWFGKGGVFDRLLDPVTGRVHASGFSGHGVGSVLLGQTPDFIPLVGLAFPLLGLVAVVVGSGQRRRIALALWSVVVATGWLITAMASGVIRPFVVSPIEAAVPAWVAFAGLAGIAVAAFRQDLARRGFGLLHALTLGAMALSLFLIVAGIGPAFLRGAWAPGEGTDRIGAAQVSQIRDVLQIEAEIEGQFRALWVGEAWTPPDPSVARPADDYMVTGPRGQLLSDLFETKKGAAEAELERAIASIREGRTDRGGSLLGAFNVRYVVLDRGPGASHWLAQRDLAMIRNEPDYFMLENQDRLERAAVYPAAPPHFDALATTDPTRSFREFETSRYTAEQRSGARYVSENASAPGVAVLAESYDERWRASFQGESLPRVEAGWANAFELPSFGTGRLTIEFPRSVAQSIWIVAVIFLWMVVVGGAFSRKKRPVRGQTR